MAHRKRRLDQLKHPFSPHPFEAVAFGSWQAVEFLKIEAGTMSMHFADNHHMVMEKGPLSDIRIRSRKATLPDCLRFLRPGIDVCVLSAPQQSDDADAGVNLDPVWVDAKISSVQRKHHDSECSCQFYVNFYVHQGSLGAELRTLNKEIKVVGINQISILQKLESTPCENQHYRWASSEDCSIISHTKLLLGKVLCDLSWLVVTTALKKKVAFHVRSLEDKLVYQVLERDTTVCTSLNNESHIDVLNFKTEKGMLISIVSQVATLKTKRVEPEQESHEDKESPSYNVEGLRRSKRRNVQPERYLGCEKVSQIDVGSFRNLPPVKVDTWKDDDVDHEMNIPLAGLFSLQKKCLEGDTDNHQKVKKASTCRELVVYNRKKTKSQKVKSGGDDQNEHENHLAIIPLPAQHDPVEVIHCDDLNDKVTRSYGHESFEVSSKYHCLTGTTSKKNDIKLLTFGFHNHAANSVDADKSDDLSSRYHYSNGAPKSQRKGLSDLDDMVDLGNKWEGISSSKGFQGKKQRTTYLRSRDHGEQKRYNYKDRSLNAAAYKDLINSYLKNMNTRPTNEEPAIADQWKQSETPSNIGQKMETQILDEEDAEEESEMDMLWRELEVSLASCYLEEETGDSHAAVFTETPEDPNPGCPHDFRMNEEIGIYCYRCGFVSTEIKYITPPFIQHSVRHQEEKQSPEEDSKTKPDEDDDIDLLPALDSPEKLVSQENENVWALIPELKAKLHAHQKKAFEFLWHNIAGSMDPELMETTSKRRGGCVISHTPGAGKTFLIIAFLVSYLKLFPGKRPLVLAPKTTLYTWYKEFIKWDIPIPVYLIHGRRTYRVFKQKSTIVIPGVPKPTDDVKHVLDCLEKIQKWHSHPSVLIMGYTSFLTLMREDSKFAHRKYMAKVLRESPGIMVLDEGHNPRSTKSRLRKVLMKVQTELRILLSGTLFQNNFCEYFNTLCLARPKFIHEVLKALDSKYKRKGKVAKKASHLLESRARKFFLDQIAKKIDSNNGRERRQGLKMLRNVTNGFIDVYEGRSSDGLPGLQIYTLLMNSTDTQHEILHELHKKMARVNGYPLELELLITLGSIHPWLVKSAVCAEKFFTPAQLMELERCKFDLRIGSKVKFVLSLIYRVVKKEKVLIFCHNIAPVKLFVEYFEKYFGWTKGREVLVLTGELELFERGRVMDKFEEPGGVAKILLASINACAEGISLTAASRVIMLDSEWNPSKTKQAIARAFRPGQQKVVYVYQLLMTGSLEEDKYKRTTWKEWVSSMIFSEAFVEDPSQWQAEKIEDYILREMVAEDRSKSFHMIMKTEKDSTNKYKDKQQEHQ